MAKSIKVGMLGMGTVGSGVVSEFLRNKPEDISLETVVVRDINKKRTPKFDNLSVDVNDVLENPGIDIVVELMGGYYPALDYIKRAIDNKKHVVTANKAVIADYGPELFAAAEKNKVNIGFEASVAGGIPIINLLLDQFKSAQIQSITGILNGTTNFILTNMSRGMHYAQALELAQDKGFAEQDPSFDVDGKDAAQKISILASLAYGTWIYPKDVYCEGISRITPIDIDYARELGYVIKLLAIAKKTDNAIDIRIHPAMVAKEHRLAKIDDEFNALFIRGDPFDEYFNAGRGAGMGPTAFSVYSDIVKLADMKRHETAKPIHFNNDKAILADQDEMFTEGYLRLYLEHVPGTFLSLLDIISRKYKWNIKDSIQRKEHGIVEKGVKSLPDIITHEPMKYGVIKDTLADIHDLPHASDPFYMRIFKE